MPEISRFYGIVIRMFYNEYAPPHIHAVTLRSILRQAGLEGHPTMKYLIVIETNDTGFSAYSPDLSGCVATGATREQVEREMKQAMEFHLEGLRLEGFPLPRPSARSSYVEVAGTA